MENPVDLCTQREYRRGPFGLLITATISLGIILCGKCPCIQSPGFSVPPLPLPLKQLKHKQRLVCSAHHRISSHRSEFALLVAQKLALCSRWNLCIHMHRLCLLDLMAASCYADGTGTSALFHHPTDLQVIASSKYSTAIIADRDNNCIRLLNINTLAVTTYSGHC